MTYNTYYEIQKEYQEKLKKEGFFEGAVNDGYYYDKEGNVKESEHILRPEDSIKGLYAPIRKDVLKYFERYNITWWRQNTDRYFPTGNLLSSQNNCLNNLFAIRKDANAILSIINKIGESADVHFDRVLPSITDTHEAYFDKDNSFVPNINYLSFEFVCNNKKLINESHETRGALCTSVDAMIYAQSGNERWLIPIEWKYTESYMEPQNDVTNFNRYSKLVDDNSRLKEWSGLFTREPYYELGRQTILMEKLISEKPYLYNVSSHKLVPLQADKFLHVIVVPSSNTEMNEHANKFKDNIKDCYQKFVCIVSPDKLLEPVRNDYKDLISYLKIRYNWE